MNTDKKLILASSSLRRQELLRQTGIVFDVHPPHIAEQRNPGEAPLDYVSRLAREKAEAVTRKFPERCILGADTTVIVDDQILEKPIDADDARRMLRLLSGRAHCVTTAVSLLRPHSPAITRAATTKVFFRKVTDQEIEDYVASGEPMDKAGAYAIQGGAGPWVEKIEGDYSNVVGLPLTLVTEMLRQCGII